jgi:hypothetical protein
MPRAGKFARTVSLRHITRRQMRVMPFGHTRVCVSELSGNYPHRDAVHREAGGIAVPQDMESDEGLDLGGDACLAHGTDLVNGTPCRTSSLEKYEFIAELAGDCRREKAAPLVGQRALIRTPPASRNSLSSPWSRTASCVGTKSR